MEWFLLLALVVAYLVLMPILLANARARIRILERKVGEFELALAEKRSEPHRAAPTGTAAPEAAGDVPEAYIKYAVGRIKQSDTNGDGKLSAEESARDQKIPASADADGDGQITPRELALAYMKKS